MYKAVEIKLIVQTFFIFMGAIMKIFKYWVLLYLKFNNKLMYNFRQYIIFCAYFDTKKKGHQTLKTCQVIWSTSK